MITWKNILQLSISMMTLKMKKELNPNLQTNQGNSRILNNNAEKDCGNQALLNENSIFTFDDVSYHSTQ
jgi:hypothetical protein